jgi:glycine oxidase
VVGLQAGLRPGSADGKPVLGPVPGWEGVSLSCGHHRNGILLSALTGKRVAEAVVAGKWDPSLAPFAATRFPSAEGKPA